MAPPPQLTAWLDENYPSPRVDPEWLDACYAWVIEEHHLDPATQMPAIIEQVESQLLQSDLCDSMSHGTGIPLQLLTAVSGTLRGPVLVEITAMTEVGASALSLDQVRVARAERLAAGAGPEAAGDDEADLEIDGEGPVPNYPRSMLRFELSDGASTLSAFEYRPLPELTLGLTPLGYKLVLKDVLVRRGMAFLEPKCVTLKGHQTEDREALQEADFARGLRHRLGRPEPEPQAAPAPAVPDPQPDPPLQEMRSPLREISPPPSPTLPVESHQHSDDEDQPRRRRIPAAPPTTGSSSSSTLATSPYFSSSGSAGPAPRPGGMGLVLSPRRTETIEIESSDDDENLPVAKRPIAGPKSLKRAAPPTPSPPKEDTSSDYGMDAMDDGFLEELQKLEERNEIPAAPATRRQVNPNADVITINDEDEDMEDKENVPAPQRHVRRRVFGEVIEIDSD